MAAPAQTQPTTDRASAPLAKTSGRIWSPYQTAVFAAIEDEQGRHLVVEALAGSGKTSTIVEALRHVYDDDSVLMVAFNRSIATELGGRVPFGVTVSTLHSYGLRAVTAAMGRRPIDADYVSKLARSVVGDSRDAREARTAVAKAVSLAKGCLASTPGQIDALCDAMDLEFPKDWDRDRLIRAAAKILEVCQTDRGSIDFDDMIWLPNVLNLAVQEYDWVFVDETQDLNPAQLELVLRAAGSRGRIVAVGDRRQAIYGFRGADRSAIPNMIRRLDAKVLPLSITYRCPVSVVREAQRIIPTIEPAPGAPEGIVRATTLDQLEKNAGPGDFVVSRTNAPLVSLCFRWLASGRRAEIRGRDIGKGLSSWIKGTKARTIDLLSDCIESWSSSEIQRLSKLERSTQSIEDKADCLRALIEGCKSVDGVLLKIDRIFGDGSPGGIVLTSTHRAKGLEADRVWLLRDTYCRWPGDEEQNLLYVGITRAKQELIYVTEA